MDKKAHGALKADKNPQIEFVISKPVVLKSNGKGFNGNISGQLMLAGVKKGIAVPVQLSVNGSNQIVIEGSKTLDMKEFRWILLQPLWEL
jgi:polyisoprenoid-binding protein YceI